MCCLTRELGCQWWTCQPWTAGQAWAAPALAITRAVGSRAADGDRRAEELLIEYRFVLIDKLQVPTSNLLYVSESNPFEAYRQLLGAMDRYRTSLRILGGCRLAVTPLSSKLVTLGAGMACFEMNQGSLNQDYGITIPYAEPMRYVASRSALKQSGAEVVSLILTGMAYE